MKVTPPFNDFFLDVIRSLSIFTSQIGEALYAFGHLPADSSASQQE